MFLRGRRPLESFRGGSSQGGSSNQATVKGWDCHSGHPLAGLLHQQRPAGGTPRHGQLHTTTCIRGGHLTFPDFKISAGQQSGDCAFFKAQATHACTRVRLTVAVSVLLSHCCCLSGGEGEIVSFCRHITKTTCSRLLKARHSRKSRWARALPSLMHWRVGRGATDSNVN